MLCKSSLSYYLGVLAQLDWPKLVLQLDCCAQHGEFFFKECSSCIGFPLLKSGEMKEQQKMSRNANNELSNKNHQMLTNSLSQRNKVINSKISKCSSQYLDLAIFYKSLSIFCRFDLICRDKSNFSSLCLALQCNF